MLFCVGFWSAKFILREIAGNWSAKFILREIGVQNLFCVIYDLWSAKFILRDLGMHVILRYLCYLCEGLIKRNL